MSFKGKAEVLQLWDPVWIFLSSSKNPIKQAGLVPPFSSCRPKTFLLLVGSTVVIIPCPSPCRLVDLFMLAFRQYLEITLEI